LLQKVVHKATPQSCFRKLFFKIGPRSCPKAKMPKATSKIVFYSKFPKLWFFKVAVQSYRTKLLLKPAPAPRSCSQELLSKAVVPKLQFFNSILQDSSPKLFCKAAPESCSQKCYSKLLPEVACKAVPQSCSQSCGFSKLLFKAVAQSCSCSPKLFPKAAPQSFYRKLLRTAAPQSC
jgi:hypothetical protein